MNPDDLPTAENLNKAVLADGVAEGREEYDNTQCTQGFKRLVVWQEAIDFVAECYRITSEFPKAETYGLTKQLRGAALSVCLNVAEGWGRNGKAEFARFTEIARASLQEVDAAFEVAVRLEYLSTQTHGVVQSRINRLSAMLLRLIRSLRSS